MSIFSFPFTVQLSEEHKPSILAERQRIELSGGSIIVDPYGERRLMGILNVSRGLGDTNMKDFGFVPIPKVVKLKLEEDFSFLFLATDGTFGSNFTSSISPLTIAFHCLFRRIFDESRSD